MEHRALLHAGRYTDTDGVDIAAQDSIKPNAGVLPYGDPPHHFRAVGDKGVGVDDGRAGFKLAYHNWPPQIIYQDILPQGLLIAKIIFR